MTCRNFREASAPVSRESTPRKCEKNMRSGRASAARCPPEPRLRPLFRRQQRVQRRYRWHLCVALYGGTLPGKNRAFTTLVDPVSPPSTRSTSGGEWWRRRVLPPGPIRLCHAAFIAIVGFPTDLI